MRKYQEGEISSISRNFPNGGLKTALLSVKPVVEMCGHSGIPNISPLNEALLLLVDKAEQCSFPISGGLLPASLPPGRQ